MKFVCDDCHQMLLKSEEHRQRFFAQAIDRARRLVSTRQYDSALLYYGNALDAADIALDKTAPEQNDIDHYIRTGMEMLFALRKAGFFSDLAPFIEQAERRLKQLSTVDNVGWLVRPLKDIAEHPICVVEFWLSSLLSSVHQPRPAVLH
ncbi:hypothetical protein [Reinekea blandensis]|uniref:Uncharacterized protein n=1 Tax=Reinekea blandensis MED297 TaxID=314283 RepID=A4BFZ8_9GAMM|nr:hypothetical protein [Reinekea blandensis]EAR09016.1 hypothetical protein MED297_03967 [Reinekea sp. MED297] [Reinekea blandensis MED297]